jgi:hypothetical protein
MVVKSAAGQNKDQTVGIQSTPHSLLAQVRVVLQPMPPDNACKYAHKKKTIQIMNNELRCY